MKDPFDPDPRPLAKATNGFIRCPEREQVVQLPHECAPTLTLEPGEFHHLAVNFEANSEMVLGYFVSCSCGWKSPYEDREAPALRSALEHVAVVRFHGFDNPQRWR